VLAQGLMELEVSQRIAADRYERSAERSTYRNGYRERQWDTRVGTIDLQINPSRRRRRNRTAGRMDGSPTTVLQPSVDGHTVHRQPERPRRRLPGTEC